MRTHESDVCIIGGGVSAAMRTRASASWRFRSAILSERLIAGSSESFTSNGASNAIRRWTISGLAASPQITRRSTPPTRSLSSSPAFTPRASIAADPTPRMTRSRAEAITRASISPALDVGFSSGASSSAVNSRSRSGRTTRR